MVAWCEETSAALRSGEPVETKLHRIAEKARKEPDFKFTSLYHLMNEELLRECFKRLRKDAAAGIGKRGCLNWQKFNEMLKRFPLPEARIRVSMFGFSVN